MGGLPQRTASIRRNRNMEALWSPQTRWLIGTRFEAHFHNASLRYSDRRNGRRSLDRIAFGSGTEREKTRTSGGNRRPDSKRVVRAGADIVQPKELQGRAGSLPEIQGRIQHIPRRRKSTARLALPARHVLGAAESLCRSGSRHHRSAGSKTSSLSATDSGAHLLAGHCQLAKPRPSRRSRRVGKFHRTLPAGS